MPTTRIYHKKPKTTCIPLDLTDGQIRQIRALARKAHRSFDRTIERLVLSQLRA